MCCSSEQSSAGKAVSDGDDLSIPERSWDVQPQDRIPQKIKQQLQQSVPVYELSDTDSTMTVSSLPVNKYDWYCILHNYFVETPEQNFYNSVVQCTSVPTLWLMIDTAVSYSMLINT